jgi:uncharacterized protein DUF5683
VAALAAAVAILAAAGPARAQAPAPARGTAPARADSATHPPRPFFVMARSAVMPGWGQVTNHEYLKAAIVFSVEAALVYGGLHAWRQELDATDRANAAAARATAAHEIGDTPTEDMYVAAYERYLADSDTHYNRKINFIWWGLGAHALNMLDAYVAANLVTFDADFGPQDEASAPAAPRGEPRLALALRVRF